MGSYTELFGENFAPLVHVYGAAVTTEQNTVWIQVAKYHRIAIVLHALVVGTTLDLDVEVATDDQATGLWTLPDKTLPQLVAADDNTISVIEIRTDELGKPTGAPSENYDWLRVEITPSAAATYSLVVYGFVPRFGPIDSTLWDAIVY